MNACFVTHSVSAYDKPAMTTLVNPPVQGYDDPRPTSVGRLGVSFLVVLGFAGLLSTIVLATGLGGGLPPGVAAEVLNGDALEAAGQKGWVPIAVGDEVNDGARIRTGGTEVRLRLRGGQVWLSPEAAARIHNDHVDLVRGEALVTSDGGVDARWTDVQVSGEGVFRVTPGVNPRVAVYAGQVRVRRPAESRAVAELEQLGLSARRLAVDPDPLAYQTVDRWDRELLGEAIAFDGEVARIARGIDVRYGRAPRPPEFYRGFAAVDEATVPMLASIARTVHLDGWFGPPSDTLVTLFVSEAVTAFTPRSLADAAGEVAQRRAEGARWGLVALHVGITASDFAEVVDLSQIDEVAGNPVQIPSVALLDMPGSPLLGRGTGPSTAFGGQDVTPRAPDASSAGAGSGVAGSGATGTRSPDVPAPSPQPGQPGSSEPPQAVVPLPPLLNPEPRPAPAPLPESPDRDIEDGEEPLDRTTRGTRDTADNLLDRLLGVLGGLL